MITVRNPWSNVLIEIDAADVTQSRLDAMAQIMDDEIRERVHSEIAPCTPGEFFARYAEIVGPDAAGVLWFS